MHIERYKPAVHLQVQASNLLRTKVGLLPRQVRASVIRISVGAAAAAKQHQRGEESFGSLEGCRELGTVPKLSAKIVKNYEPEPLEAPV